MPEAKLLLSLAKAIETTASVMLRLQQDLLATANDIAMLSECAKEVLRRVRGDAPSGDARTRLATTVSSISDIELLTRSQTGSLYEIAARFAQITREAQRLCGGLDHSATLESNIVPLARQAARGYQAGPIGRRVEDLCRWLGTIQEAVEKQHDLTCQARDRLRSIRLCLETVTAPSAA